MEQIILGAITHHIQDNQTSGPPGMGLWKAGPAWAARFSAVTLWPTLVDVGKAVAHVRLNFSKDLDTISCSILLEKLAVHGLDGCTLWWVKKWLDDWAQRVGVTKAEYSWWLVSVVFPRALGISQWQALLIKKPLYTVLPYPFGLTDHPVFPDKLSEIELYNKGCPRRPGLHDISSPTSKAWCGCSCFLEDSISAFGSQLQAVPCCFFLCLHFLWSL